MFVNPHERISELEDQRDELVAVLEELVHRNEVHNVEVEKIIGHPPSWSDSYLNKARAVIKKARGE